MQLLRFVFLVMSALVLLLQTASAAPKVPGGAIKKGGKGIKHVLGALGAAGTAHEVYNHVRNRR